MILKNLKISRLFATTFNVILRRERSELSGESRNIMALSLNRMHHPGASANELTLKATDDESGCLLRCRGRWLNICCNVFKYPSTEANVSISHSRGEVTNEWRNFIFAIILLDFLILLFIYLSVNF